MSHTTSVKNIVIVSCCCFPSKTVTFITLLLVFCPSLICVNASLCILLNIHCNVVDFICEFDYITSKTACIM